MLAAMTDSVSGSSATTALLPAGSQVASNIDTPGDADWWRITLTAGTTYLFDLVGSSVDGFFEAGLTLDDPFLALRGASGATLLSDDDSGVGLNARILFTPTQTGIYYLDAQGYDGATGSYALIANANPVTGTLDGHPVTSGVVDWPGDTVLTSVTLAAGSGYVFNVDGSTLVDPFLELLDASGNVVDYDDDSGPGLDSQLAFVPDTAGLYYVAVRSVGHNATGQYTLRVESLPGLSIAGATAIEGNSGQASLVFQLTLSTPSATTVSVNVETMAETAQPGTDYVTTAATVTFLPGRVLVVCVSDASIAGWSRSIAARHVDSPDERRACVCLRCELPLEPGHQRRVCVGFRSNRSHDFHPRRSCCFPGGLARSGVDRSEAVHGDRQRMPPWPEHATDAVVGNLILQPRAVERWCRGHERYERQPIPAALRHVERHLHKPWTE